MHRVVAWVPMVLVAALIGVASPVAPLRAAADSAPDAAQVVGKWLEARARALAATQGRYRSDEPELFANRVDRPNELSGAASSAVVYERRESGKSCVLGIRELTLDPARRAVAADQLLGEDCCQLDCPLTSPAAALTRLLFACRKERTAAVARLIPAGPGTLVIEDVHDSGGTTHATSHIKSDAAAELCQLSIAKFACDAAFSADDKASCRTEHVGERYTLTWARRGKRVWLERVEGSVDN